jgi:hypothetical protein
MADSGSNTDSKKNTSDPGSQSTDSNSNESSLGKSGKFIEWSAENEMIMVEWCDVAQCYKWMNAKSHSYYSMLHAWFTIPAITLSTISGTASFAQASLPPALQTFSPMVIGALNIFIGILTTVQQYLKISELNEAHRVAAISWDKFARNIRIELAKAKNERTDAGHFIKSCRQEFDRLMETSPSINPAIIAEFTKTLRGKDGSVEREYFDNLKKPDICNVIISANEYRHPWYKQILDDATKSTDSTDENDLESGNDTESEYLKNKELELMNKENAIREKEAEFLKIKEMELINKENAIRQKEREEAQKELDKVNKKKDFVHSFQKSVIEIANRHKEQTKKIDEYVTTFTNMYGRKPIVEEIQGHFKEMLENKEIEEATMTKFLDGYTNHAFVHLV